MTSSGCRRIDRFRALRSGRDLERRSPRRLPPAPAGKTRASALRVFRGRVAGACGSGDRPHANKALMTIFWMVNQFTVTGNQIGKSGFGSGRARTDGESESRTRGISSSACSARLDGEQNTLPVGDGCRYPRSRMEVLIRNRRTGNWRGLRLSEFERRRSERLQGKLTAHVCVTGRRPSRHDHPEAWRGIQHLLHLKFADLQLVDGTHHFSRERPWLRKRTPYRLGVANNLDKVLDARHDAIRPENPLLRHRCPATRYRFPAQQPVLPDSSVYGSLGQPETAGCTVNVKQSRFLGRHGVKEGLKRSWNGSPSLPTAAWRGFCHSRCGFLSGRNPLPSLERGVRLLLQQEGQVLRALRRCRCVRSNQRLRCNDRPCGIYRRRFDPPNLIPEPGSMARRSPCRSSPISFGRDGEPPDRSDDGHLGDRCWLPEIRRRSAALGPGKRPRLDAGRAPVTRICGVAKANDAQAVDSV